MQQVDYSSHTTTTNDAVLGDRVSTYCNTSAVVLMTCEGTQAPYAYVSITYTTLGPGLGQTSECLSCTWICWRSRRWQRASVPVLHHGDKICLCWGKKLECDCLILQTQDVGLALFMLRAITESLICICSLSLNVCVHQRSLCYSYGADSLLFSKHLKKKSIACKEGLIC